MLVINEAVASSNQKAPFAEWPAGNMAARSFNETPTTRDLKFVANRNSSVIVETNKLCGDICPTFPEAPTPVTVVSSVQYQLFPVTWSIQSLPTIPSIAGMDPEKITE